MKLLKITHKGREVVRAKVLAPLLLIGRSPLCDVVLRAPDIASVHFIMEWIGADEFKAETASGEEWVVTIVGKQPGKEKTIGRSVVGEGALFYDTPLQIGDLELSWVEDRLAPADLNEKILSRQLSGIATADDEEESLTGPPLFEVVCINKNVDSVTEVQHYPLSQPGQWRSPILKIFACRPTMSAGKPLAQLRLPPEASHQVLRGKNIEGDKKNGEMHLALNDVLRVQWNHLDLYFRVVPKITVPVSRRTIWSDPFYILSTVCVVLGVFGFYLIYKNIKPAPLLNTPPRIARIEIAEPPPPAPSPVAVPPKETIESKPVEITQPAEASPPAGPTEAVMPKGASGASKGSVKNEAPPAARPRSGFLAAIRKTKNIGMVRADQVIDQGIVRETVSGDKGVAVLQQSESGIITNNLNKKGDGLQAASSKFKLGDTVGNGSLKVGNGFGDGFKDGTDAGYGSGEDGSGGGSGNGLGSQVEGGLDKMAVQAAIRAYKAEIRTCYEKALRMKSDVGGRVVYRFQIEANGKVSSIRVEKSDLSSGLLVSCVQDVVKGIPFPKAKNGQNTLVLYPFQFARKGD